MTAFTEAAVLIGADPPMVGVITRPGPDAGLGRGTCVILLGAGLVHRVGPNRLAVRLARSLAADGYLVIRFDHRGIGDSGPRTDGKPFEDSAIEECCEVMDHIAASEGIDAFVPVGLCSGAETAIRTAFADARVCGAVMINGGGQGVGQAWDTYEYVRGEARRYMRRSLFDPDSWRRALTGRIQYGRLLAVMAHTVRDRFAPPKEVASAAGRIAGDIERVLQRGVRLLWVQSEGDSSRRYFETMFGKDVHRLLATGNAEIAVVPYVDHLLTARHGQERFLAIARSWFAALPDARRSEPAQAR